VSVFEAGRRLSISATALRRAGTCPSSRDPRRDGGRNLLPFLDAPRGLPCGSGKRAASRAPSVRSPLGAGSSSCEVCPTAMGFRPPHLDSAFAAKSVVRIDVHGPSDRVKDVSARVRSVFGAPTSSARALLAASRRRSPPRRPKSTHCHRCVRSPRRRPRRSSQTDQDLRSDGFPRRTPPSRRPGAFHRRDSRITREDFSTRCPRRPPTHAAHTFSPGWGKVLCFGPCERALEEKSPGVLQECGRLLCPLELLAPGTDDPSAPTWLGRRGLVAED